jgi:hypothetical protein
MSTEQITQETIDLPLVERVSLAQRSGKVSNMAWQI